MKHLKFTLFLWLLALLALPARGQGTLIVDSLSYQNLDRIYRVFLPSGYTGATPLPVMFALHGAGGDAEGMVAFTEMDLVADTAHFIAVFPQGATVLLNGFTWAAGNGTPADSAGIDDVGFLTQLIDELASDYAVDTARVYAVGLSNGGFMTQRLACEASDKFAALGTLTAYLDNLQMLTCNPARPAPMFIMNGTADAIVPYNGNGTFFPPTETVSQWWADLYGCNSTPELVNLPDLDPSENSTITQFTWDECDCGVEMRLYKVNGGGHTWPGVENIFYELIAGQTNEDIHASVEAWNFFKDYSLACNNLTAFVSPTPSISLQLFPNPARDNLIVRFDQAGGGEAEIEVWDGTGKRIRKYATQKGTQGEMNLDVEAWPRGIYVLKVRSRSGYATRKLILR